MILNERSDINARLEKFAIPPSFISTIPSDFEMRVFNQTPNLSPQSYAIFAGEFKELKGKVENLGAIPIRILYIDPIEEEISKNFLKLLQMAITYYQKYFHAKFPYTKLDSVLIPSFDHNPYSFAGVTVMKNIKPNFIRSVLYSVVSSWIGNATSTNRWDSFWLYKGLSEYITNIGLTQCPDFKNLYPKNYLLRASSLNSFYSFTQDMDIYLFEDHSRSVGIIQQLAYILGDECFKEVMVKFIKKYSNKCAGTAGFVNELRSVVKDNKLDIDTWANKWLLTKGSNILKAKMVKDSITVIQEGSIYREYKCDIALYDLKSFNEYVMHGMVIKSELETVIKFPERLKEQAAVLLDVNNDAYVRTYINKELLPLFRQNLHLIKDSLHRLKFYQSLALMVKDCELPPKEFIDIILEQFEKEHDKNVMIKVLKYVENIVEENVPAEYRLSEAERIFNLAFNKGLLKIASHFAYKQEHQDALLALIDKQELSCKHEILKAHFKDKTKSLEQKQENFNKYGDEYYKYLVNAPDLSIKNTLWISYLINEMDKRESIKYFWSIDQVELLEPFIERFFKNIIDVFKSKSIGMAVKFFNCLKPKVYDDKILSEFQKLKSKLQAEVKPDEVDQKVLLDLVKKEVEKRKQILKSHKLY